MFGALAAPLVRLSAAEVASASIARFSTAPVGATDVAGWQHQLLPKVERSNTFGIVEDAGDRVLRVRSAASASSWIARLSGSVPAAPVLRWRWKVSRAVAGSDLRTKAGDDYAARLYVLFDLPLERLALGDRLRLQAARALSGADLPAAAICYVWGTAQAPGSSGWNPYTDRLRMIVVESGNTHAMQWRSERRDLRADWQEAFGGTMPRIAAVAVGADTDNTGESVDAWFGDVSVQEAPRGQ
jgi:hypothetical protein